MSMVYTDNSGLVIPSIQDSGVKMPPIQAGQCGVMPVPQWGFGQGSVQPVQGSQWVGAGANLFPSFTTQFYQVAPIPMTMPPQQLVPPQFDPLQPFIPVQLPLLPFNQAMCNQMQPMTFSQPMCNQMQPICNQMQPICNQMQPMPFSQPMPFTQPMLTHCENFPSESVGKSSRSASPCSSHSSEAASTVASVDDASSWSNSSVPRTTRDEIVEVTVSNEDLGRLNVIAFSGGSFMLGSDSVSRPNFCIYNWLIVLDEVHKNPKANLCGCYIESYEEHANNTTTFKCIKPKTVVRRRQIAAHSAIDYCKNSTDVKKILGDEEFVDYIQKHSMDEQRMIRVDLKNFVSLSMRDEVFNMIDARRDTVEDVHYVVHTRTNKKKRNRNQHKDKKQIKKQIKGIALYITFTSSACVEEFGEALLQQRFSNGAGGFRNAFKQGKEFFLNPKC